MNQARTKLEHSVLGTFIVNPSVYYRYNDVIIPEMFRLQDLARELFETINKKGDVKIEAFAINMESKGYGDVYELVTYSSLDSIDELCKSLNKQYIVGQEIIFADKTKILLAGGDEPDDVLSQIGSERSSMHERITKREDTRLSDFMEVVDNADAAMKSDGMLTGVPTGFVMLDEITNGWQKTDMVVIAGRPGMGKTTNGLQIAMTSAKAGKPAKVYSTEMSRSQLIRKMISINTGISVENIRAGRLDNMQFDMIKRESERLYGLPLYIEDRLTHLDKISNDLRLSKRRHGIELCVIDYLQRINTDGKKGDTERVGEISRRLKDLAGNGDCSLAMIALAQLSREVEKRANKRPELYDLRNSGDIEQDADMVLFLYRDWYYGIEEDDNGNSTEKIAEIDIAKNRHGRLDTIKVGFEGRFYDLAQSNSFPVENNLITRTPNDGDNPF